MIDYLNSLIYLINLDLKFSLEGLSSVVELWVWGVMGSWLSASCGFFLSADILASVGQESVAVWELLLLLGKAWWNGGWVAVP